MSLPLGLLSLNLLAAILSNRVFRSQAALLMFHIGLLCVLLLASAGILLRFEGSVEIVEGAEFEPRQVTERKRGWLHSGQLDSIEFTQGPIEVRYRSGLLRDTTRSRVEIRDHGPVDIGDRQGVTARGYRFLTTFNKGYAVLLMWEAADGDQSLGAVNFPSYPDLEWKQVNDWTTPGGETLRLELELPERAADSGSWTLASGDTRYRLAVSSDRFPASILDEGDVLEVQVVFGQAVGEGGSGGRVGCEALQAVAHERHAVAHEVEGHEGVPVFHEHRVLFGEVEGVGDAQHHLVDGGGL